MTAVLRPTDFLLRLTNRSTRAIRAFSKGVDLQNEDERANVGGDELRGRTEFAGRWSERVLKAILVCLVAVDLFLIAQRFFSREALV